MKLPKVSAVIPARFHSSRYPGKPLVEILGVPLVVRVANNCIEALGRKNTWVATDDDKIVRLCEDNEIQYVMTSSKHPTGTDRVAEAAEILGLDLVINLQGDEPLVAAVDVAEIAKRLAENPSEVMLGCAPATFEEGKRRSIPKLVRGFQDRVIYVSRVALPADKSGELNGQGLLKQVAIYGFSRENLGLFADSPRGLAEATEDIEILRFLEIGVPVRAVQFESGSVAVDYPEDILKVEKELQRRILG